MKNYIGVIFLSFCLCGCVALGIDDFFDSGYYNQYGQYVPKRPRFKLKDKKNNIIPLHLDTVNIYCARILISYGDEITKGHKYLKMCPNGRCFKFNIFDTDTLYKKRVVEESDLNPKYADKRYYFSKDGINIQIECFWKDWYGRYDIDNFYLSQNGDTLVDKNNSLTSRYIRQEIPKHWKKYKVDW